MQSAVITADIVNSTFLDKHSEKKLYTVLKKILAKYHYEFYRGDSIQIYIKNGIEGLQTSLLLRTAAKRITDRKNRFDLKISIGIGFVNPHVKNLMTAKDQAFILSGRAYDRNIVLLKKTMTISCGKEPFDTAFEILADHANELINRLTPKQSGIIHELLMGQTQFDISKQLKMSQPTISKQARAANWGQIQELLFKFERLFKFLPE